MKLHTKRLLIRQLDLTDYSEYLALASIPEVAKGAGFNLISNPQMVGSALKRQLKAPGTLGLFKDDRLIGAVLLFERIGRGGRPDPNHLEISYFLRPDCWQQGYMSESIQTLTAYLKKKVTVSSVIAEVFADNERSINLLKRLDFSFVTQLLDPIVGKEKVIFELKLN